MLIDCRIRHQWIYSRETVPGIYEFMDQNQWIPSVLLFNIHSEFSVAVYLLWRMHVVELNVNGQSLVQKLIVWLFPFLQCAVHAPVDWNSLPDDLHAQQDHESFRRAWKPGFSSDTCMFSALETFVITALYKSTFTIPYHKASIRYVVIAVWQMTPNRPSPRPHTHRDRQNTHTVTIR